MLIGVSGILCSNLFVASSLFAQTIFVSIIFA